MDGFIPTVLLWCCFLQFAFAQTDSNGKLESCNVVCNCNSNKPHDSNTRPTISQGPPGKLGPKGNIGPVGSKGGKGDIGLKGDKGTDADDVLISHILSATSAITCQDLETRFRINRSGYYLMMDPETMKPEYNYCDFRRYQDVNTCRQLFAKYNFTRSGNYIFGRNSSFKVCLPKTFIGIYTCQAIRNRYPGLNDANSGFYEFKSTATAAPSRVYCNFSETSATTEVHHDNMGETSTPSSCEDDGCFTATPHYEVTGNDLTNILDNSQSCRQFLKLRCKGVQIRRGDSSWWVSRNGNKMLYWGGATSANYCACGESNSCLDTSFKCNCDQNSGSVITADEGYLTDKTKLPLREIRIGDHGGSGEVSWYTIGKLECFGQV